MAYSKLELIGDVISGGASVSGMGRDLPLRFIFDKILRGRDKLGASSPSACVLPMVGLYRS